KGAKGPPQPGNWLPLSSFLFAPSSRPARRRVNHFVQLVIPSEVEESLGVNMTQLSPTSITDALQSSTPIAEIQVQGWVRTRRDSKDFSFIELNDGSSLRNLQIIARNTLSNYPAVQRVTTGASISVTGALVASQ